MDCDDNEEEDNNNKDNNDDKGFSALGLDRDLGFSLSEAKKLSEVKKTPAEQLALLSPDRGVQF